MYRSSEILPFDLWLHVVRQDGFDTLRNLANTFADFRVYIIKNMPVIAKEFGKISSYNYPEGEYGVMWNLGRYFYRSGLPCRISTKTIEWFDGKTEIVGKLPLPVFMLQSLSKNRFFQRKAAFIYTTMMGFLGCNLHTVLLFEGYLEYFGIIGIRLPRTISKDGNTVSIWEKHDSGNIYYLDIAIDGIRWSRYTNNDSYEDRLSYSRDKSEYDSRRNIKPSEITYIHLKFNIHYRYVVGLPTKILYDGRHIL